MYILGIVLGLKEIIYKYINLVKLIYHKVKKKLEYLTAFIL